MLPTKKQFSVGLIMRAILRQATKSTTAVLATTSAALSYVLLCQNALHFGLRPTFQLIVDFYTQFKSVLLSKLQLERLANYLAERIADLFNWQFSLEAHWSDIFVLLFLYFSARARSYWVTGAREHALVRVGLGAFVAFLTGVASGLSDGNGLIGTVAVAGITFVGIFVYEIVASAIGAWRYRKPEQTWAEEFWRYLAYSLPTAGMALVIFIGGIVLESARVASNEVNTGIVSLLVYSVGLAAYWAYRGWHLSKDTANRKAGETQMQRFLRSSTTMIAFYMGASTLGAFAFILSGAGWSTLAP